MPKKHFIIGGMTCSACSSRVEKAVGKLPNINSYSVNLLKNSMIVDFDDSKISIDAIIQAVEKAGYSATLAEKETSIQQSSKNTSINDNTDESAIMKRRLILSLIFVIPLFYISMGHMLGAPLPAYLTGTANAMSFALTQFLLVIPIAFINFKYYSIGYKTLLKLSPNMDSLIAIGSSAAIIYGIYAMYKISYALGHGDLSTVHHFSMDLYFESAGVILTLITLGKFLESRAKNKTSNAITKLMNLSPKTAILLKDGKEVEIALDKVNVHDTLIVKAGATIATDGIIIEGYGIIDESALTGESLPVEKTIDKEVIGGTINTSGYFKMKVTKVGQDTALSQIIKLVDEATSTKAPIAKIADKISGYFVPVVITLALLTTIGWLLAGQSIEFALSIGISVLVISCPCALGLATPTAIMVGTGKGANLGILLKSAEALEITHKIDTIVLDKTGTITNGTPQVTDIYYSPEINLHELLALAISLEQSSEHPLAYAIVKEAQKYNIAPVPVQDFKQLIGQGICAKIQGKQCFAGNQKLLQNLKLNSPAFDSLTSHLAKQGKTPLYFIYEQQIVGLIALADTIKDTSYPAIKSLQEMGLDIYMLTGDNKDTAQNIANKVGIAPQNIIAEVLPQDKEAHIRTLQLQGKKVAMVGDGINDAPALARADIGIAIGTGTDIAIDSAKIILMKNTLSDVAKAIELSKAVIKNIKQNLFWAFIYNIIGIPIAMGLFYTALGLKLNPMLGAFAMSFSSVFVVTNALRLRFFQPTNSIAPKLPQKQQSTDKLTIKTVDFANLIYKGDDNMGLLGNLFHNENQGTTKIIGIEGMMCQHCVNHVLEALQNIEGVTAVKVSLEQKNATVQVNENVDDRDLKEAIIDAGYEVTSIE